MWIPVEIQPDSPRDLFYKRLTLSWRKRVLAPSWARGANGFTPGAWGAESEVGKGRPHAAGGNFEGLGSERAIAWRVSGSMSGRTVGEYDPDEVISGSLQLVGGLLVSRRGGARSGVHLSTGALGLSEAVVGRVLGIDATTSIANVAMHIVRWATKEDDEAFVKHVAVSAGVETLVLDVPVPEEAMGETNYHGQDGDDGPGRCPLGCGRAGVGIGGGQGASRLKCGVGDEVGVAQ